MTVRKLSAQPASRRIRWYVRLLDIFIRTISSGAASDLRRISLSSGSLPIEELLGLIRKDLADTPNAQQSAERLRMILSRSGDHDSILRAADALKHAILHDCGLTRPQIPVEHGAPESGQPGPGVYFPGTVVLAEDIRSPYNIGSIIRSSEAFGIERCILVGSTVEPGHPRLIRAAMGSERELPVQRSADLENSLPDLPVFALETGGVPAQRFRFPDHGVVLVGNEEFGLSDRALQLARSSAGLVSLPMYGSKQSLNVANALTAVLSWWTARLADHVACVSRQNPGD